MLGYVLQPSWVKIMDFNELHQSVVYFVMYTDGVLRLVQQGRCVWFLEHVATNSLPPRQCAKAYGDDFARLHVWSLLKADEGAIADARAVGGPIQVSYSFEWTDSFFPPSGRFELWVALREVVGREVYIVHLPGEI